MIQQIEIGFYFILVIGLLLLSQWAVSNRWARILNFGLLALIGGLIGLASVFVRRIPVWTTISSGVTIYPARGSLSLAILAISILAPLAVGIYANSQGKTYRLKRLQLSHPITLTSWTLLGLNTGGNIVLKAMVPIEALAQQMTIWIIVEGKILIALAALIGVGWGVRRNWSEVLARLGWRGFRMRDPILGTLIVLILLFIDTFILIALFLLFKEDVYDFLEYSHLINQQLTNIWMVFLMAVATGIGEELLYRGALQPVLGIWLTSLIFALGHVQYLNPFFISIFISGLILGWARNRWGLGTAIWSHFMYNALIGLLSLPQS